MTGQTTHSASRNVLIAFDFGTRFIGVAIGNRVTGTASPLPHLRARDGVPDWSLVSVLLEDWQPERAVVGLPLNMDGSESTMTQRARKFANRLHGRFGIQVHCHDERLSSFEARQRLSKDTDRRRGGAIDSMAAVVILEHWLVEQDVD